MSMGKPQMKHALPLNYRARLLAIQVAFTKTSSAMTETDVKYHVVWGRNFSVERSPPSFRINYGGEEYGFNTQS